MPIKRIICVANSRKRSGHCVAGKELTLDGPGPWIRPISSRSSEELAAWERRYRDGSEPGLLDIFDVPLRGPHPTSCQTENWLIDPSRRWERVGRLGHGDLPQLLDDPPLLWSNESRTYHGANDRVAIQDRDHFSCSLHLLRVRNLHLRVFAPRRDFGDTRRRVQAGFAHRGQYYRLWVTDPIMETEFLAGADGEFQLGECFITVSLGEPHGDGFSYKLIAAVIRPRP